MATHIPDTRFSLQWGDHLHFAMVAKQWHELRNAVITLRNKLRVRTGPDGNVMPLPGAEGRLSLWPANLQAEVNDLTSDLKTTVEALGETALATRRTYAQPFPDIIMRTIEDEHGVIHTSVLEMVLDVAAITIHLSTREADASLSRLRAAVRVADSSLVRRFAAD